MNDPEPIRCYYQPPATLAPFKASIIDSGVASEPSLQTAWKVDIPVSPLASGWVVYLVLLFSFLFFNVE